MNFFEWLNLLSNESKKNNDSLSELTDEEKELIKNGNYDETSFEEEDLEEDDYYYEDSEDNE